MKIEQNELKKRVNNNLVELVTYPAYNVHKKKALEMLTPNRFDIIAK